MDFEVLVDDLYLNLLSQTALTPVENKSVLSLLNDFEDEAWRYEKFENFIWDNIALTALSAQERKKLTGLNRSILRESAKNLRLTDKAEDKGQGSELAEIVLYGIMHHHFKALSVVPKIFYKQNAQDFAKGADSVHIVLQGTSDFSLWFGEAKFYNSIEDVRLATIVQSVGNSLRTDKLKKENSIITNTSDLDLVVDDAALCSAIKSALDSKNSIDGIKPKIHIPILLLHECAITAASKIVDASYRNSVRNFHLDRATAYIKKQIDSLLPTVPNYAAIKFHIILFPVPSKELLVKNFSEEVATYKKGVAHGGV